MLGYIRRNFNLSSSSVKLLLYKSLVRSKLEYAASIWDPYQETLIYQLESIQNRAARFILSNYHRNSSVSAMKSSLSLPLLSQRRNISRLCLFHKIYYDNPILKRKFITPPCNVSARIDHRHKVGILSCQTNHFYNSFNPSTSAQ
uniref:Endonuclease/reverse transcript n=1 Tax=Amblyomma americanum TaxID=6943 RepID=A0A0C9QZR8_AMBAM